MAYDVGPFGLLIPRGGVTSPPGLFGEGGVFETVVESIGDAMGWVKIDAGTETANFTIPVPPGDFRRLQLSLMGRVTDGSHQIAVRVNNDGSTGLHNTGMLVHRASDGALTSALHDDIGTWRVAEWTATFGCMATVDMRRTHVSTNVSYEATGTRVSSVAENHRRSTGWGRLNSSRLVESLRVLVVDPGTFHTVHWELAGLPA